MNQTIDFLSPASSMFLIALLVAMTMAYLSVRLSSGQSNKLSRRWPIYLLRSLFLATLLALLLNPVRVTEREGPMEPSQVFFLLDASESMAIGNENETRWDDAIRKIGNATKAASEMAAVEVSLFQFGRRLKAVDSPEAIGLSDTLSDGGLGVTFVEKETNKTNDSSAVDDEKPVSPADEPDTQLASALQQISSRFGRKPPAAVVVFSDGRARDASRADLVSETFGKLGVPIHAAPVGSNDGHGDITLVSLVVPSSTRKQSEVNAQVFLRSYGFDNERVKVQLNAIDEEGQKIKRLATVPVQLQSGFQSIPISFRTDSTTQFLEAVVSQQPNEVSTDNNRFESELTISREKIRVLYFEGSRLPSIPTVVNGNVVLSGPTSALERALKADPDIECVSIQVSADMLGNFSGDAGTFPGSAADLSGFDAVILSDVPKRTFTDKQLEWFESWVRQRGGGLCMLGGRNSFGSGEWNNTPIEKILPVKFKPELDWQNAFQVELKLDTESAIHPMLQITSDDQLNRDLLDKFPAFTGANVGLLPKPDLSKVLAVASPEGKVATGQPRSSLFTSEGVRRLFSKRESTSDVPEEFAVVAVGQYGKGRSMAMGLPITGAPSENFLKWGTNTNESRYYSQFWRNTIYWLTERSSVGRRRLVGTCDKRHYGPGETITLDANAFMETSRRTTSYKIIGMIEPQSFDQVDSDYSVVRWPNNVPRPDAGESAFVIWGEEFELPVKKIGGVDRYQIELPIAETLPSGSANQSMRIELTAYEDGSQVDSTSVPIQILHDPFEQQNPFPNHELLTTLAKGAGGKVLESDDDLANLMKDLPISRGPSEFSRAPIWSQWWAMCTLLGLATSEWCYRRWIGLA